MSMTNKKHGWALWMGLAVAAGFAWPLALPAFLGRDADRLFLFYPAVEFARGELFAGRVPLWNPYKFMGSPFLANLMIPFFYPPQTLGLLAPQPFGQNMVLLGHAALAAALSWGCARRAMGLSRPAAALAAMTFTLSAPMFVHMTHYNQFYAMAWLPGTLWAGLGLGSRRWVRAGAVLGLVMGLQGLTGQPQIVFYGAVIAGCSALFAMRDGGAALGRAAASLALGGILGFGLAGVHLIPGMELEPYSFRMLNIEGFSASFSLPWRELTGLVTPGASNRGEMAIFCGQAALALAVVGLLARRNRRAALAGALVLAGLALALGDGTPFYPALCRLVTPLAGFRATARAFIVAILALAMLAGMGLDVLRALIRRRSGARAARLASVALIAIQCAALLWNRAVHHFEPYTRADIVTSNPVFNGQLGLEVEGRVYRMMTEVDYLDERPGAIQEKLNKFQPDANMLVGAPLVLGYDEGMLPTAKTLYWMDYHRASLYTPRPNAALLGLMGAHYIMSDKPIGGDLLDEAFKAGPAVMRENLAWRGMVFTRADWPEIDFEKIATYDGVDDPDFDRTIFLPGAGPTAPPAPHLEYENIAPGVYEVRLLDPATREVILSETSMPGWEAIAPDGRHIKGRRLAAALIGFDLPEGVMECRLVYRPLSFRIGAAASLTSLAILALIGAFSRRKKSVSPENEQ